MDRKVHELSANLEVKLQALAMLASASGNDHQTSALRRLKDTVRSAATVLSGVSTTIDEGEATRHDVRDDFSITAWEPDDHFHQWIATIVDFSSTSYNQIAPPLSLLIDETTVPGAMIGAQPHDTDLPAHREESSPVVTPVPVPSKNASKSSFEGDRPAGHVRSISAPNVQTANAKPSPTKPGRTRFWNRSKAKPQHLSSKSNLQVHDPKSRASFAATHVLSENRHRFQVESLLAHAKKSMSRSTSKVPARSTKNGKTCLKAVYVGDGACGKTCAIVYVSIPRWSVQRTTKLRD